MAAVGGGTGPAAAVAAPPASVRGRPREASAGCSRRGRAAGPCLGAGRAGACFRRPGVPSSQGQQKQPRPRRAAAPVPVTAGAALGGGLRPFVPAPQENRVRPRPGQGSAAGRRLRAPAAPASLPGRSAAAQPNRPLPRSAPSRRAARGGSPGEVLQVPPPSSGWCPGSGRSGIARQWGAGGARCVPAEQRPPRAASGPGEAGAGRWEPSAAAARCSCVAGPAPRAGLPQQRVPGGGGARPRAAAEAGPRVSCPAGSGTSCPRRCRPGHGPSGKWKTGFSRLSCISQPRT